MNSDNFQKIKARLPRSCRFLAERALLTFLALVFVSLVLGGGLFYKYSFLADKKEPEINGMIIQLKEDLYQKVVNQQQNRQMRFDGASAKSYPNSFK